MTQSKELIRAVATEEGHPTERALPANLELTWTESMSPEEVIVQARERVREALAQATPLVRGHVFCHHCNDSRCQHSTPGGSSEVFAGYQSTGRPRFEPLLSYLIELGDDRLEYLTTPSPSIVARVVGRRRLLAIMAEYKPRQLKVFDLGSSGDGLRQTAQRKTCPDLQAVETGDRRIRPQLIGSQVLLDAMADGEAHRLVALLFVLRQSARKIEALGQDAKNQKVKRARPIEREGFQNFATVGAVLERKGRQRGRRTKHAEKEDRKTPRDDWL